jgi:hypothetical protein
MGKLLRSKVLTFVLVMSITAVVVTKLHQQQGSQCGPQGSGQSIAFQIDANHLPPGAWAEAGAVDLAKQLGTFNCTQTTTMVGAALYLGLHLIHDDTTNLFDLWDATTPHPPAEPSAGIVQCVAFVASTYRMALGKDVPMAHNAVDWWADYANQPGFTEIAVGKGLPQPGDFIVFGGGGQGFGHIAVIIGVQDPQGQQDGAILTANGNSSFVLSQMTLHPDMTLTSGWIGEYVLGYIRLTSQA